jgi:tetraacyldisaccharide 4'-kinase
MGQWQVRALLYWGLMPLSWVYTGAVLLRKLAFKKQWLKTTYLPVPTIVVGNIFVGGTGKTPVVIALVQDLLAMGKKPGLVSRGYGVKISLSSLARIGQITATHTTLDSHYFGDEPSLIASLTGIPIAVHPKRVKAAQSLIAAHPEIDILICDDGLQHLALGRNVEIVVQDQRGTGNGLTFPAGPLREPMSRLKEVDAILTRSPEWGAKLSTTHTPNSSHPYLSKFTVNIDCFQSRHDPLKKLTPQAFIAMLQFHPHHKICAMAAIGLPKRFFLELQNLGINLDQAIALPDHAMMVAADFRKIQADEIVITAKDAVKLQNVADQRIWVAHTQLKWFDSQFTKWVLMQCRQDFLLIK